MTYIIAVPITGADILALLKYSPSYEEANGSSLVSPVVANNRSPLLHPNLFIPIQS
ncbi:MAG: hypothetical protein MGF17_12015 [Trichodesmium sp. MAG_R04]|nr:hypothetical protein [Trichodesmium sp. MAG_R04]